MILIKFYEQKHVNISLIFFKLWTDEIFRMVCWWIIDLKGILNLSRVEITTKRVVDSGVQWRGFCWRDFKGSNPVQEHFLSVDDVFEFFFIPMSQRIFFCENFIELNNFHFKEPSIRYLIGSCCYFEIFILKIITKLSFNTEKLQLYWQM